METVGTEFRELIAERIKAEQRSLSAAWLARLVALMPVGPNDVFPTDQILDHIPQIVFEIGRYLRAPADEDIAASPIVAEKARELGQLRHAQQASVHQVLREYDLLAVVLDEFIASETLRLELHPTAQECFDVSRLAGRAVRVVMQFTVATFIREYTDTIREQTSRIDQFGRAIGHELRNPLATVQFAAGLLESGEPSADDELRLRLADTIKRNSERAMHLLRSLEQVLVRRAPGEAPVVQEVELGELVGEVYRQLDDMARAREVALRAGAGLPVVETDTASLELVLINLVSNAIKYSDGSKPQRFVEIDARPTPTGFELRVRDNGLGIPAGMRDKVFDRFVRAHSHLDGELGTAGSGLGLAIVQQCVSALNASIRVESEEGQGTTFTIEIPSQPRAGCPAGG